MTFVMRSSGLHHAVSLGTIEVSSKSSCSSHFDRSYDSEDENMSRRRLRHTASTELCPRASIYSKGDIREQYCLTDRQLNSIERPRRDRFFGCLSRRGAPPSLLGVCVGRRAPSDENLAAYAPFYKHPRYHSQNRNSDKSTESDLESSYFRRQPASILSSAKMADIPINGGDNTGEAVGSAQYHNTWVDLHESNCMEKANISNAQSSYHCPTHIGTAMAIGATVASSQTGPSTPRTKHVSFARSHTLTSFDDVNNLGFRSSGRIQSARSQERLIGGKKPMGVANSMYEPVMQMPQKTIPVNVTTIPLNQHQSAMHQHPAHAHSHQHGHGHSHQHQHHHGPVHIHQFVPTQCPTEFGATQFQVEHTLPLLMDRPPLDEINPDFNLGTMNMCSVPKLSASSPEVVVIEKKFRNVMKTQATQTDLSKDGCPAIVTHSPRALHKVKVVSQGAQTNGLQSGKKLTKSLSEMPNGNQNTDIHISNGVPHREIPDHEIVYRTQSDEPPRSPSEFLQKCMEDKANINYYRPPPPVEMSRYGLRQHVGDLGNSCSISNASIMQCDADAYTCSSGNIEDSYLPNAFSYMSNSLPRRTCNYHRLENEFNSNSLPRKDPSHSFEICKHITECSELMHDSQNVELTRQFLLPPPLQYRKTDDEEPMVLERVPENKKTASTPPPSDTNRRLSMITVIHESDMPFRRDDVRRQSMPVYVKTEKLIDGYGPRNSVRLKNKLNTAARGTSEEEEIFIDFKPHISPKPSPKIYQKYRKLCKTVSDGDMLKEPPRIDNDLQSICNVPVSDDEDDSKMDHPLYENVTDCMRKLSENQDSLAAKRDDFRKRSISLEDAMDNDENVIGLSAPPSPCRDEMLANVSTYPSSDSLANDVTRDHSDGIWNESQVTVLTAEQKDTSEGSHNTNLLLTPSSKRKHLLLQHQQRSSIDTDALDFEEQFMDHSPTYSSATLPKTLKVPSVTQPLCVEQTTTLVVPMKVPTPSIAVTQTFGQHHEAALSTPNKSPSTSRRSSNAILSIEPKRGDAIILQNQLQKCSDLSLGLPDGTRINITNNDISECSTNTDDYATCTDTSKRTPGIKTPPTTTSSSSTTQIPVSTQSSQIDRTHGGSSFESASSLYSTRGEVLVDDNLQFDEKDLRITNDNCIIPVGQPGDIIKKSPSHSVSSTSSGSYNVAGLPKVPIVKDSESACIPEGHATTIRTKEKIKPESISDDERSEVRYSSSGYYESPHDDEHVTKSRRYRLDEDRKRRRTSMKLDIEKENMRALTSPVKKHQNSATANQEKSPEKTQAIGKSDVSPSKMKRFRPKIRRQFRKISRDESAPRRQKNLIAPYGISASQGSTEKLLDCSITSPKATMQPVEQQQPVANAKSNVVLTQITTKSVPDASQLKAKSIESLRSVSPGSDSVFYSEADGNAADKHNHCLHCGKEMEGQNPAFGLLHSDSVESIPCIDNDHEQDIVKPPSDFADSPVTTKTTQRLYKKMDKRFRSEERYHGERGRHYKSRQENIRAKSEERSRESQVRNTHILRPAGSSPSVLPDVTFEQNQQLVYRGHYDCSRYVRLTDADIWSQLDHQSLGHRERIPSTESERSFHTKYQVILHRLVQRRCTLEMYHRQKSNAFQLISSNSSPESVRRKLEEVLKLMLLVWARESYVLSKLSSGANGVDKTVVVKSDSGEFGFRIHGSKPVVVAAIEPDTPAESSGLEVGDIIISVNDVQVLDKHHTEVVKIAHDGCETLELQVARTIGVLMNEQQEELGQPIFSGYLWRQSGQAKGAPNTKKWVRRWFCLRPDNCLYYYKTEDDNQPVGAMIMAKHTIEHCPLDIGKPFAFKVDSGEGIPLYVAADTEELSKRWIKILKQSATQESSWLDKCTRYVYQPPNSISRPDCFGYLLKMGSKWSGWSKRYCVLKDACLYFYQDVNSKSAFGMTCLHGYKVSVTSVSASGRKNSFELVPPEGMCRYFYFSTESDMDRKRWVSALEYSIDRWIKSG